MNLAIYYYSIFLVALNVSFWTACYWVNHQTKDEEECSKCLGFGMVHQPETRIYVAQNVTCQLCGGKGTIPAAQKNGEVK